MQSMKWQLIILIGVMMMQTLINPVSAEIIPVDEKYESKCEAGISWIFCKATEIWENWFKDRVIEISKENPLEQKLSNPLGTFKNIKTIKGWVVTKQDGNEQYFDVKIADVLNKDTEICLTLKKGIDPRTVDLTAKPISNQLGQVTDKSVPMTLAYEPAKCIVDNIAVEGYKLVLSDPKLSAIDNYVKIGTNSLIIEYQNESKIQYDFDFGQTNITLLKDNKIYPEIYVFYNERAGKIDFGAEDYSSELKNYTYILNSTKELIVVPYWIFNKIANKTFYYPSVYNYDTMIDWKEARQQYSFKGVCNKEYSNCSWIDNENSFILNFKSYGDIDTKSITNVSGCGTLSTANEIYNLNKTLDVTYSDSLCFVINANNITLNGMGYNLSGISEWGCDGEYGLNEADCLDSGYNWVLLIPAYGIIESTKNNSVIKNFSMISNFSFGMDIYNIINLTIDQVSFTGNTYAMQLRNINKPILSNINLNTNTNGLYLYDSLNGNFSNMNISDNAYSIFANNVNYSKFSNLYSYSNTLPQMQPWFYKSNYNNFTNITTRGGYYGFQLDEADNNIIISLNATNSLGTDLILYESHNNKFTNFSLIGQGFGSEDDPTYGLLVADSMNNIFENGYVNVTRNYGLVVSAYGANNCSNNYFKNIWLNNSALIDVWVTANYLTKTINNTFLNVSYDNETVTNLGTGKGAELIRKWYYSAYVNYTNGTPVNNINVTVRNVTNSFIANLTTSLGYTPQRILIEYTNTNGTRVYQSPYNNSVNSMYQTWNLTTQRNNIQNWTINLCYLYQNNRFILPPSCRLNVSPQGVYS